MLLGQIPFAHMTKLLGLDFKGSVKSEASSDVGTESCVNLDFVKFECIRV